MKVPAPFTNMTLYVIRGTSNRDLSSGPASPPRIDHLPQIMHQRAEDQRQVHPPRQIIIRLDAAIGGDQHVLGLEALRQHLDRPAVGGIRAGGREPGGLPENAAEEPRQLADQQAGAPALVDRLLARLLDENLETAGELGRLKAVLRGELVDQRPAERFELGVGQPAGPADASFAQCSQAIGRIADR